MSSFANLLVSAECILALALVAMFFNRSHSFERYLLSIAPENRGVHNSKYLAARRQCALFMLLVFATFIAGRCTILYLRANPFWDYILMTALVVCVARGLLCVRRENHAI